MKKIMLSTIMLYGICVFMVGCSHNGFAYYNGKVFNIGYNSQTNQVGIQYADGEGIVAGVRENTSIEVQTTNNNNLGGKATDATAEVGSISTIKLSTGVQMSGYVVDLANANDELAKDIINNMYKTGQTVKYYIIKDNKVYEVSKEIYDTETQYDKLMIDGINNNVSAQKATETTSNTTETK